MNHHVMHPKKENPGKIMQLRFYEVRTAIEPHGTAVRCGSIILEPQNRAVRFEVLDVGTGTAPFRGLGVIIMTCTLCAI